MGRGKLSRGRFDYLRKLLGVRGRKPRPPRRPAQKALVPPIPAEKQRRVEELRRELAKRGHIAPKRPAQPRQRPRFRAMTDNERALAVALGGVKFPVGSTARFARELRGEARSMYPLITNRQANYLRTLVHRYRRQINPSSLPRDERHLLLDPKKKRRTEEEDVHV